MEHVKTLVDVKIGDEFFVYRQYSRGLELVKCEKITPKRCTIGRRQYTLADGQGWGSSGSYYHIPSLMKADDEARKEYGIQVSRKDALEAIGRIGPNDSTELLVELHDVIKKYTGGIKA